MRIACILMSMALVLVGVTGCEHKQFDEKKAEMRDNWDSSRSTMIASLAEEAYQNGELTQARERAIEALALDRDNPTLRLLLVRIYIEEGNYKDARKHLEVLEESQPDLWEVPYFKGVVYEKQRDFEKALKFYDEAHEMAPRSKEPVYASVEVLAQMGRTQEARQRLEGQINEQNPSPQGCELAGRLAIQAKDYNAAIQHLSLATSAAPQNNRYPEMLAQAHRALGHYDQVIDLLETQLDRSEYDPPYTVYLMLGEAYMSKQQLRKATQAYEKAADDHPDDPAVWRVLAIAQLADGQHAQAVKAARQANELEPDHVEGCIILGYALLCIDRHDQALWVLQQAHTTNPRDALVICLMGRVLDEQGKDQQAEQLYALANRIDPNAALPQAMLTKSR